MNVACTCAGQDEAKPEGTKQQKHPLGKHLVQWRQIGASLTSALETSTAFVANGCREWSLASPPVGHFDSL